MARTPGSRAEITGPLIRQAALRLFARDGYNAVSMRRIAAEVGVQVGTLYAYTPDKQALLYDLLDDHMQVLLAEWRDAPDAAPVARLRRFVGFHIRFHLARPDAVFLSYMELRALTPANRAAIVALRRRYEGALMAILQAGTDTGAMRLPDLRLGAMAILAMLTGVTTWYRPDGRLEADRIEAAYWDLVRATVGAEAGAGG